MVTFTDNAFLNSPTSAMYIDGNLYAQNVTIERNVFQDNGLAFTCFCDNAVIQSNTFSSPSGEGPQVSGTGNIFAFNDLLGVRATSIGDGSTIEYNTFDGATQPNNFPLATIAGFGSSVVGNEFKDGGGLAVFVFEGNQESNTDTEIILNTFDSMVRGIEIEDASPGQATTVTARIGWQADLANVFINPGGGFNPTGGAPNNADLVELDGVSEPIDATFNNWGLCTLPEIEAQIYHQPDEVGLGLVDYDPFIDPGNCPTPTPIPTPTPTPSPTLEPTPTPTPTATTPPTPSPTATPTASPGAQFTQGDNDCDEDVDPADALADLRNTAGLPPLAQQEPCPDVGTEFASIWGDMDCDEDVDAVDALAILRHVAGLPPLIQMEPCPDVGSPI